ncbi:MAG: hypothetical protein E4H27_02245 [Anaerolineales bacterium]|nr:MAG: hypothetical protein E4H27_02245 [Anaerolineales bacterium]
MGHFFKVDVTAGSTSIAPNSPPFPMELFLGYKSRDGIISDTLQLYRLDAGTWVTNGLTITERLDNGLGVMIDRPGTFGLMGKTLRTYLPHILRGH